MGGNGVFDGPPVAVGQGVEPAFQAAFRRRHAPPGQGFRRFPRHPDRGRSGARAAPADKGRALLLLLILVVKKSVILTKPHFIWATG